MTGKALIFVGITIGMVSFFGFQHIIKNLNADAGRKN